MVSSMKLRITISMAIGLALVLTSVISAGPITQKAYASASPSSSSLAPGGSLGQSKDLGGVTTGAGTAVQSGSNAGGVDPNVFCKTGVITPICK
ncbi:MAG: hypothetical protein WBZ36_04610 [Candidatus Nitrosopolaris sp.]